MIVTCPSCRSRYFVHSEAIGEGKLVRCTLCGNTWEQAASKKPKEVFRGLKIVEWAFFFGTVIFSLFLLVFNSEKVIELWPEAVCFYDFWTPSVPHSRSPIGVDKVSNFFVLKNNKLYMGLRGEIFNTSRKVQTLPKILVSLEDINKVKGENVYYKKHWTHTMKYKKILPNQKLSFETEIQSVPCRDLRCTINFDIM